MTPKQQRFIEEYLVDLNATQAAIRAGYSERTAYSIGQENLNKPEIQEAIQEAAKERSERTGITAEKILMELAMHGTSDVREIFADGDHLHSITDLPDEVARCVQGVDIVTRNTGAKDDDGRPVVERVYKVKLTDKLRALELAGRHVDVRAWLTRHEHSGPDGGPIPVTGIEHTIVDPAQKPESEKSDS